MDISVINISKGPNELNSKALDMLDSSKLSFNVTPRLRYSDKSDYVGFQIDLMVMQDNTQVFRSGFLVGLAITGWAHDLQNGLDLNKNHERLTEICETVWLVATGIVAIQSSTEGFNGLVLPKINYEDFSKDVLLISETADKSQD